ncbi:MAG: D-alanine--D-alanine ligase [candidate division FCPU426 bacterium]
MKVALLYNQPLAQAPDAADVLDQVKLVESALNQTGTACRVFALPPDWPGVKREWDGLTAYAPDVVFNLVEALGADARGQARIAGLLELSGWAFTGSGSQALVQTTDKALTKSVLAACGLPTPAWQVVRELPGRTIVPGPWIIKPLAEDASVGIDEDAVVRNAGELIPRLTDKLSRFSGQGLLLETFLEGREFNVSLLERVPGRVEALPPAEIKFEAWPAGQPRLLTYRAKWDPAAFEYRHTPRAFVPAGALAAELQDLATACWRAFGLRGYARVDFRQDQSGKLWVLEVNANPCLSPDAGFMAAVKERGLSPGEAIQTIMEAAAY